MGGPTSRQGLLFAPDRDHSPLARELADFAEFGPTTRIATTRVAGAAVPTFHNEFWTARQRAAARLHEVSYRACFKAQLPRFFIERLTAPGDTVYDPFMGRGTTPLEAALLGRVPAGNDINPLSRILLEPRLCPPPLQAITARLDALGARPAVPCDESDEDLLVFYHPDTLAAIRSLRAYFLERENALDDEDRWIRMVAVNRLTGHSPGFFSVYTMPPNQAVSVAAQQKINRRRNQTPERREVRDLILRKTRSLLSGLTDEDRGTLATVRSDARLLTAPADATPEIPSESVHLVITSPPFLDVVQYAADNWLRCWFCGIDPDRVAIDMHKDLSAWQATMTAVFRELRRVLVPGGHVAFEVGEVRGGRIKLEQAVLPCGLAAGLEPELILINEQQFTKTANCWGVANNEKGTNSNRVVLFRRPPA